MLSSARLLDLLGHCNMGSSSEHKIDQNKEEFEVTNEVNSMEKPYRVEIIWKNVAILTAYHVGAIYGFYLSFFAKNCWALWASSMFFGYLGGVGITLGAHRLWTHRSFKAKWPLRLLAAIAQTTAGQTPIYEWARDHQVHHKFSETDADPHNAKRGFFFAHMGWLMCKKHPEVKRCGKMVDCSDVLADPIVYYQRKYFRPLLVLFNFIIPTLVPWYLWGESLVTSFFFTGIFRFVCNLHITWSVNSVAHLWGSRPYDKTINPAENKLVAILSGGEGWHNYHHVFPWDYRTAELGSYATNFTAMIIDFFAWTGLAYDLRTVSDDVIRNRVYRTGDGSHANFPIIEENKQNKVNKAKTRTFWPSLHGIPSKLI